MFEILEHLPYCLFHPNIFKVSTTKAIITFVLTLCMLGNFSCLCCFFKNNFYKKYFENIIRVRNSLIQIKTDVLLVLGWVQTVCQCYQQLIRVPSSTERVKKRKPNKQACCSIHFPTSNDLAQICFILGSRFIKSILPISVAIVTIFFQFHKPS